MAPWRSRRRSRTGLETAPPLLVLLAAAAPWVALGLPGHPYPLEGNPSAGLGEDFNGNNVWTNGKQIGLKNSARAYMVKNCQANNWWGAGFQRFHLLGNTLTFTADLSAVGCGCVATLYFVAMGNPGPNANYCDIQQGHGYTPCFEVDIMEANSHAFHSSLHARQGEAHDGTCNARVGCIANLGRYPLTRTGMKTKDLYGPGAFIDTKRAFQVEAVFDLYGNMRVTLHQDGHTVPVFNQSTAGNLASHDAWDLDSYPKPGGVGEDDRKITASAMQQGLVLVASLWSGDTHWLDTSACGGSTFCNLGASWYTVTDFEVKASPVELQTTAKTTEAPVVETTTVTEELTAMPRTSTTTVEEPTASPQTSATTTALPELEEASAKPSGETCEVGDVVPCPYSELHALCAGMQCCASTDGQSFVCPSAPPGWNQCMGAKRVDCLAATTATTTVPELEAATTAMTAVLEREALVADTSTTEHEQEAATTTAADTTEAATTTSAETEAPTTTSGDTTTTEPVAKDTSVVATTTTATETAQQQTVAATTTTVAETTQQQTASTTGAETTHERTASTTSAETAGERTAHTENTEDETEKADNTLAEINAAMADAGGGREHEVTTTTQPSANPTTVSPNRTKDPKDERDEAAAASAEELADEVNQAMENANEGKQVAEAPAKSNETLEDASTATQGAKEQRKVEEAPTKSNETQENASKATQGAEKQRKAPASTTTATSTSTTAAPPSTTTAPSSSSSTGAPASTTSVSTTLVNLTATSSSASHVEEPAEALSWQCHDYTGQNGDGWCNSVGSEDGWDFRFFKHGIGSICGGCWCCKRRSQPKKVVEVSQPPPQEPLVLSEWRCHSYSAGQTDSWCSSTRFKGSHQYRFFNSSDSHCGKPLDGKPGGCQCCKREVASWQCHDYLQGQDDNWCKSIGVQGQYQYDFNGGVDSPCQGCWCCKRAVVSQVAAARQAKEAASFKEWRHFEDLAIGENRACRGATLHDSSPDYYKVHMNVLDIHECMDKCRSAVALGKTCSGIEFSSIRGGRCEVWHRPSGIGVTVPVMGVTCLRFGRKREGWEAGVFSPADGGINRACRGEDQRDAREEHYEIYTGMSNLGQCKARCQAEASLEGGICRGIEFSWERGGRCEVWKRPQGIEVTVGVPGVTCLRFGIMDDVSVAVKHVGAAVELQPGRSVVRTPEGLRAGPHVPLHMGHGAAASWAMGGLLLVMVAVLFVAPRRAWAAPAGEGPEARSLLAVAGTEGASEGEGEA